MAVERGEKLLSLDDRGFEGVQVVSLADAKPSWIEAGIGLLRAHRPGDAVGLTTLVVLGIESYTVAAPWALTAVASLTAAFGMFVIWIGRTSPVFY